MATKKKETAVTAAKNKEKVIARVVGGNLNIRPEKSTEKDPVGVLPDGSEVEVLKHEKTWCKIEEGYVMTQYLVF